MQNNRQHTARKTWKQVIAAEVFGDVSEALEEKYRNRPLRCQNQCARSCLLEESGVGVNAALWSDYSAGSSRRY